MYNSGTSPRATRWMLAAGFVIMLTAIGCRRTERPEGTTAQRQMPAATGVTLIASGSLTDRGFNQSHADGLRAAERELGGRAKIAAIGNVPETGDAERILRRAIADGNQILIAASYGYRDTVKTLAEQNKAHYFLQVWGDLESANVRSYSVRMYESWYVMGVVAGGLTKTNKLGIVGSFELPPMNSLINAFTLGAQSVNPDANVTVVYINAWADSAKARDAAESLIASGSDVIGGLLDNTVAIAQVAEARGKWLIGHNVDLRPIAPRMHAAGTAYRWDKVYAVAISEYLGAPQRPPSAHLNGGIAEGFVDIVPPGENVPQEVRERASRALTALRTRELNVYSGPIRAADGKEVVPAGKVLSPLEGMAMPWLVQGVRGN